MGFLKNLVTVGKNKVSEFKNDIEQKAEAIEYATKKNESDIATLREKAIHAELMRVREKEEIEEKQRKVNIETEEILINARIMDEIDSMEDIKCIKGIISSGDNEKIKATLTSRDDVKKCISDKDFRRMIIDYDVCNDVDYTLDAYITYAKNHGQFEIADYLKSLTW
jgi:hypothetical protein